MANTLTALTKTREALFRCMEPRCDSASSEFRVESFSGVFITVGSAVTLGCLDVVEEVEGREGL